jgi:hypothetical protein
MTTVIDGDVYDYYGPVPAPHMITEAAHFMAQNSDAQMSPLEETLKNFLRRTREDCTGTPEESAAAWLTIRMTKPTDEYTLIPRWHQDGVMFPPDRAGLVRSKYAMTILGKPTRIMVASPYVFEVVGPDHDSEEMRQEYAERLASQPLENVATGQIFRFSYGQLDSPVHSEPDMNSDRVFLSVLYGSEAELRRMCDWRHERYRE